MKSRQWNRVLGAMFWCHESNAREYSKWCFRDSREVLLVVGHDAFAPIGRDYSYAMPPRAMPWAICFWPYRPFFVPSA